MAYGFMSGCLRASNVLSEGQNLQAMITNILGEVEQDIVKICINDPNLNSKTPGWMAQLIKYTDLMQNTKLSTNKRSAYQALVNKYVQLVQGSQQKNTQVEQQWDAPTQEGEQQSNTLATDEQQLIAQCQSLISAMATLISLLQSL